MDVDGNSMRSNIKIDRIVHTEAVGSEVKQELEMQPP
jgi:hypothetical protein